jgi:hypothetical protein
MPLTQANFAERNYDNRAMLSVSGHRRTISKRLIEQPEWLVYEPEHR